MKAPAVFALFVRAVGVFLVYQTVHAIIGLVNMAGVQFPHASRVTISLATLLNIILLAVAAFWFLKGAPPLQDIAYPNRADEAGTKGGERSIQKSVYDGPPCVSCGERIPTGATKCPHCGWTQP